MSIHDDYVTSAGYEIRNPSGPRLLVLLHGLGGDRAQPLGVIGDTAPADFAVLAWDARAHGETTIVGDEGAFTFESLLADLLALIRALGQDHKPTYVMGISMGAAIALRLLLSQHLDIRGASLVRPAFDEHPYPANLEVMPVIGALLTNRGKDGYADFLTTPEYAAVAHTSESAALSLRQQFRKSRAEERAIRLLEVPRNTAYDSRRDLGDVRVPAQVLGAHGDPVHPLQLARIWADNIPGATYVDVPSRDADPKGYDTTMRQAVREHIDATFPS